MSALALQAGRNCQACVFSCSCAVAVEDAVPAQWLVTVVFLVMAAGSAQGIVLKLFASLIQDVSHWEQRTNYPLPMLN